MLQTGVEELMRLLGYMFSRNPNIVTPQAGLGSSPSALANKVGIRSFGSSEPYTEEQGFSKQQADMLNEQEEGLTQPHSKKRMLAGLFQGGRSGPVYPGQNITQSPEWEFWHHV